MATIKVSLEFLSWLSETLEIGEVGNSPHYELNDEGGCTVMDLLRQIASANPRFERAVFDLKLQQLSEKVSIFHNGRQLELKNGLQTELKDGDALVFLPMIQGGINGGPNGGVQRAKAPSGVPRTVGFNAIIDYK